MYIYIYTYRHIYVYIYICICVNKNIMFIFTIYKRPQRPISHPPAIFVRPCTRNCS